jgi:hypothetical protein
LSTWTSVNSTFEHSGAPVKATAFSYLGELASFHLSKIISLSYYSLNFFNFSAYISGESIILAGLAGLNLLRGFNGLFGSSTLSGSKGVSTF